MKHPLVNEIIDILPTPGEKALILDALDWAAHE
jgi:hypothetical protein